MAASIVGNSIVFIARINEDYEGGESWSTSPEEKA